MTPNRLVARSLPRSGLAFRAGAVLLLLAGCNRGPTKPDNMPELTPCVITVTYQGQAVQEASVLLAPKAGQFSAAGTTDASGRAVMKTNAMFDGVTPGEFRVSITKREKAAPTSQKDPSLDPAEYAKTMTAPPPPQPKSLIPEKYSSFGASGLTLTVSQGTPVAETFELTDK